MFTCERSDVGDFRASHINIVSKIIDIITKLLFADHRTLLVLVGWLVGQQKLASLLIMARKPLLPADSQTGPFLLLKILLKKTSSLQAMLHWNCFNNKAHSRIRSVRSKSGLVRMFYLPGDGVDLLDGQKDRIPSHF